MQFHKIKLIYLSIFAAFLLPFAFYTDFFPFLRLGMFAEKPVHESQQVIYSVWVIDSLQKKHEISTKLGPFEPERWHYLVRKYLINNKINEFLQQTSALLPAKSKLAIEEKRIYNFKDSTATKTIAIWPKNTK